MSYERASQAEIESKSKELALYLQSLKATSSSIQGDISELQNEIEERNTEFK